MFGFSICEAAFMRANLAEGIASPTRLQCGIRICCMELPRKCDAAGQNTTKGVWRKSPYSARTFSFRKEAWASFSLGFDGGQITIPSVPFMINGVALSWCCTVSLTTQTPALFCDAHKFSRRTNCCVTRSGELILIHDFRHLTTLWLMLSATKTVGGCSVCLHSNGRSAIVF